MGFEIERKFLVKNQEWESLTHKSTPFAQGYLNSHKDRTVRIRIAGHKGILTIKGKTVNTTRQEFEYDIPLEDAKKLLLLCEQPIIRKVRHLVVHNKNLWEIDVFEEENEGLIVAEVELNSEDQLLKVPFWIGAEVSHDPRYYNANLISHPFTKWKK